MSDEWFDEIEEEFERPRDPVVDLAKAELLARFFPYDGTEVYYGRQLEILLEKTYFHWITKKALNELAQAGEIAAAHHAAGTFVAHFYWPRRHRYPRRQIAEIAGLITEFSAPEFTAALGATGESLFDGGMARIGFRVFDSHVRRVGDVRWTQTDHNLDRIV